MCVVICIYGYVYILGFSFHIGSIYNIIATKLV